MSESITKMLPPLPERMRPKNLSEYVGQRHLVGEGCILRNMLLLHTLGSSGSRKDHPRPDCVQFPRTGVLHPLRSERRSQGGARGDRRRPEEHLLQRRCPGALHRRDPPFQQGPAGRPARCSGVRHRGAHRRHHRKPLLRGHNSPSVALPGLRAEVARRRGSGTCR